MSPIRRRTVPVISQAEVAECGLACLAMIVNAYGHKLSMRALRAAFPPSIRGMTLAQMASLAGELGMDAACIEFEPKALHRLPRPCILHWGHDHFVVLVKATSRHVIVNDPASGRRKLGRAEALEKITGVGLLLKTNESFGERRLQAPGISFRAVTGGMSGIALPLIRILLIAIMLEAIGLVVPLSGQLLVDHAIPVGDRHWLIAIAAGFAVLLLAQAMLNALRSWLVIVLGTEVALSWGRNIFAHLMRLPSSFFLNRPLGDILSRFEAVNTMQFTLTNRFVEVLLDGATAVFTAIVLSLYSLKLAAITFVCFLLYSLMRLVLFRPLEEANQLVLNGNASVQSILVESIRGVQTIKLNNAGGARIQHFFASAAEARRRKLCLEALNVTFTTTSGFVQSIHSLLVLAVGAGLVMDRLLTVGALMAYVLYSGQFADRATKLLDYGIELRMLFMHADRLSDIVLSPPESSAHRTGDAWPTDMAVEFRNVSFRYHKDDRFILKDCSFVIPSHEVIAIVGPSGCGKTTLAKLLLGLLDPESGQILIGGVDTRTLGKEQVRQIAASVLQDDLVFSGSIESNIHFFSDAPDPQRVESAAKLAQFHDEICGFWMGYRTIVGDMGASLSAGQRQRLLLARAIYRDPGILVLDEATSHLDVANERLVAQALRGLGMTRLVIAHRPQTISMTNGVLEFVDEGTVRLVLDRRTTPHSMTTAEAVR
jgi:ATP-binding cassette subfamily B protein RaxB